MNEKGCTSSKLKTAVSFTWIVLMMFETALASVAAGPSQANGQAAKESSRIWLTIRSGGHRLELPKGETINIAGAGTLDFKDNGRFIQLSRGQAVTIEARVVTKERPVVEGETVSIINKEGTVIWRVNRTSPSAGDHAGWITINAPAPSGELTLTRDREAVVSIWRRPEGGLAMPPTVGETQAASTAADDISRYDSLAAVRIAAGRNRRW